MLARGHAIREVLKQPQYHPLSATEQIAVLLAATTGLLDNLPSQQVAGVMERARGELSRSQISSSIEAGDKLSEKDRETLLQLVRNAIAWKALSH
jgi:F-type H+-transporting ATPase subunit alpha